MLQQIAPLVEHYYPHLTFETVRLYDTGNLDFFQSMMSK
jgi:hypothetical protein